QGTPKKPLFALREAPLPGRRSRGRDRGFPEEQLENVSGPQALRFQKAKGGNVFATAGAPVAAPAPRPNRPAAGARLAGSRGAI
ncbi:MAG: hypothetical protein CVU61_16995, partial [Deltaproteobacteria bacterium HGW-Deltaproteobacteria-19]